MSISLQSAFTMFINKDFSPPVVGNHGGEPPRKKVHQCLVIVTLLLLTLLFIWICHTLYLYGGEVALSRHGSETKCRIEVGRFNISGS